MVMIYRYMRNIFFTIIIASTFSSCENDSNKIVFESKSHLKGIPFSVNNLEISSPQKILASKNILIIIDQTKNNFIKIIDLNKNKLICQFGQKGKGPNEILLLSDAWIDENNNNLELLDLKLGIMYIISLDSLPIKNLESAKKIYIQGPKQFKRMKPSHVIRLNDSLFIGSGFFDSGRFVLMDGDGRFLRTFDDFEFYGKEFSSYSDIEKCIILQGQFTCYMPLGLFAFATSSSACIQFYKQQDNKVQTTRKLNYYVPFGFLSITSNLDNVFLLYSGKRFDKYNNSIVYGERVFVYDWEGSAKEELDLDKSLIDICYCEEKKSLIGISVSPEPELILYKYDKKFTK